MAFIMICGVFIIYFFDFGPALVVCIVMYLLVGPLLPLLLPILPPLIIDLCIDLCFYVWYSDGYRKNPG